MFQGGIDDLSVELLADIFDRLEDDDLASVSSVCKYWFDVVNHYLLQRKQAAILRPELSDFKPDWLLNNLSLIGFDGDQFERLPESIHLKDLHRLHVGYEDSWGHNLDELALVRLIDSCESLKILSFKNVALTDSLISYILNHCFNSLDSLTFDCCYFLDSDTITKTLNQSHFLEFKLIVRDSFSEQLSVYAHYPFYYKTISNIGLPKYLTRLQMDCSGLTEDSFKCLRHCQKLHTLQLLNAFNVDDEAVVTFTRLPELRRISFSDAKKISSVGWRTLFSCAKFISVVLVRCVTGLCDSAFENASAASKCLDLDLQNCKRVTGEGLATVLLLPERLSLSLDYGEELIDRLVSFLTLGLAPRLRCLDIVVQRLHATSVSVSSHLSKVKRTLLRHSNRHHIRFTFKERFTRVECIYQPSSAISL